MAIPDFQSIILPLKERSLADTRATLAEVLGVSRFISRKLLKGLEP